MRFKNKSTMAVSLFGLSLYLAAPSCLALDTWEFQTGKGETIRVKKGLFGTKAIKVQDRLGNKYETDNGFFGTKKNEVRFLGNGISVEKDIFGRKSYIGSSILGDKVESKRSWFGLGPRKTTVNVSGVTSLAEQLLGKKNSGPSFAPNSGTQTDNGLRTGGIPQENPVPQDQSGFTGGTTNKLLTHFDAWHNLTGIQFMLSLAIILISIGQIECLGI